MKISNPLSDESILGELGERLARARLEQNLTQASLAEETGLGKRTVERLESGDAATQLSSLVRVFRALGLIDRLDALVPEARASPMEQLKRGRARAIIEETRAAIEHWPEFAEAAKLPDEWLEKIQKSHRLEFPS